MGSMRCCYRCQRMIEACNGCVLAGDLIDFLEGRRVDVRELCGWCALKEGLDRDAAVHGTDKLRAVTAERDDARTSQISCHLMECGHCSCALAVDDGGNYICGMCRAEARIRELEQALRDISDVVGNSWTSEASTFLRRRLDALSLQPAKAVNNG